MALRKARTEQGLTLEEVAARTRIPLRSLAALEADDYGRLPEAVYVRGYLRRCGALLSLDGERLLADFESQYGEYTNAGVPEAPRKHAERSRKLLLGSVVVGLGVVILMIILLSAG